MSTGRWTEARVPDLAGKRAVVTGATSGLGRETARVPAAKGAEVVLAVRDIDRGEKVAAELRTARPGARVEARTLDLASLASIAAFADRLTAEIDRLDILANNAGVMVPPLGYTEDAFELNRRLGGTGPTVCASHPGWTRTHLQRHSGMLGLLNPIVGMRVEQGVLAPLRAAADPGARSGDFFGPDGRGEMRGYPVRVEPVGRAKNAELARRQWEVSDERTGVAF